MNSQDQNDVAADGLNDGNGEGRGEGRKEGIGEGIMVGRRVGKGVTDETHRKADPIPPFESNPGRQVQVVEPVLETLLAGQLWHWAVLVRTPMFVN